MGQYYKIYLGDKNGNPIDDCLYESFYGIKLMEFSWWENTLMKYMYSKLYHNPLRIAFIGDYAEEDHWLAFPDMDKEIIRPEYRRVWGELADDTHCAVSEKDAEIYEGPKFNKEKDSYEASRQEEYLSMKKAGLMHVAKDFSLKGKYLVNHDTKEYISLDRYYKDCKYTGKDYSGNEFTDCVSPLSILTAVGNGEGGGDYRGSSMYAVGRWAWNLISVEDEPPEGYEGDNEHFYDFVEGE